LKIRTCGELEKLLTESLEKLGEIERLQAFVSKAEGAASECRRRKETIIKDLDKKLTDSTRDKSRDNSGEYILQARTIADVFSFVKDNQPAIEELEMEFANLDIELSQAEQTAKESLRSLQKAQEENESLTKMIESKQNELRSA